MLTNMLRPLCLMRICEGSNSLQTTALIAFCSSVVARYGCCLSWVTRFKKVSLCFVASSGSVAASPPLVRRNVQGLPGPTSFERTG